MFCKKIYACLAVSAWLFAFTEVSFAQTKLLDKANELYKANQYAEAASLYEQALEESASDGKSGRNSLNLKTKLAYCYRMNNRMDKAEVLYAEVVQDDKAKPDTYYYYGEALMGNGKYEEAKRWFLDYQKLEPNDEKGKLMAQACEKVAFIEPVFPNVDIQEFEFNSPADDNAPIAWQTGILFSSDRAQGVKLLKEKSGWTGRDYLNLYLSEKSADGVFSEPKEFSSKLSEVNKNVGNATVTADGSEIFFTRNDNVLNKLNTYSLQLFHAENSGGDRWKNVEKLSFCSSNFNFMHPSISPDGKRLFFATNKAGGVGGTDLWVTERTGEKWGVPQNLGPVINTLANEGFPFVDAQGRLYFCSKGHAGFGGFDIFYSEEGSDGQWSNPINLGRPINSPFDDISIHLQDDGLGGMFTSSRSGGDDDIFLFKHLDKSEAVAAEIPVKTAAPLVAEEPRTAAPLVAEEPRMAEEQPIAPAPETETPPVEKPVEDVSEVLEVSAQPMQEVGSKEPVQELPPVPPLAQEEMPVQAPIHQEEMPIITEEVKANNVGDNAELPPFTPLPEKEGETFFYEKETEGSPIAPFLDLTKKLEEGNLVAGTRFRLDGATYDPLVWQLTPRVTVMLDRLVAQMKIYPSLQIEISAHTESLGVDEDNLRLSQNRVETVLEYMVREGIDGQRIIAKGCGESMPLNHCRNGVNCSMAEYLINQRLEVKVLALDGKW